MLSLCSACTYSLSPLKSQKSPSITSFHIPTKRINETIKCPNARISFPRKLNNAMSKKTVAGEYGRGGSPEVQLPAGLRPELMPKHVAMFPDGQRRWAKERGLTVEEGDKAGVLKMKEFVEICSKYGVKVLTVFAFSTENWVRPKVETDILMRLFEEGAEEDLDLLLRLNCRCSVIGDRSMLPKSLREVLNYVEEVTKNNTGLHILAGLNYGGRYDILQACKSVANKAKNGELQLEDISENIFERELETKCTEFPSPDLYIRTSSAHRLSNFLLWQAAYSELFVMEKHFPAIEEEDFIVALKSFQKKENRYGGQK